MMLRRAKYPRVKVYGGLRARKQPRDSLFLRELRETVKARPICDSVSTDNSTLVGRTKSEGKLEPQNLVV